MDLDLARRLSVSNGSKMLLFVMDGLGGLPHPPPGGSELETARTPNLDALARESACGFTLPVGIGVTPGSGPGHLSLFGYDPLQFNIGGGAIIARRAGRISSERCAELCAKLREIRLDGAELFVEPVREHRFVLVLRGGDLSDAVADTDPPREGAQPLEPRATAPGGGGTGPPRA